jgi:flagellar assembly factor FliW
MLTAFKEPSVSHLTIRTLQKGPIAVTADQLTTFVTPLLGFPTLKRWLFYQTESGPIHWMQSVEDSRVGFCLLAPFQAGLDPDIEVGSEAVSDLGAQDASDIDVFTMVVLDRDPAKNRTNLRAPILVCRVTGLAKQVVLHDARLPVRFFLHDLKPLGR